MLTDLLDFYAGVVSSILPGYMRVVAVLIAAKVLLLSLYWFRIAVPRGRG